MSNKKKSNKKNNNDPQQLNKDKEETVEVKQLLKDERTHKIAGSIFLVVAFLLFLAFTSYLFTWQDDQDIVFSYGYKLLLGTDAKAANLLGTLGAILSHFFIYKSFGIGSYMIAGFFFMIGVNLFFGVKFFSIPKNVKYLLIGLPLFSITASVITNGSAFPWGGAVGDMVKKWMYLTIGQIGTYAVLFVTFLGYFIWRFNPVFRLPSKMKWPINENVDKTEVEDADPEVSNIELALADEEDKVAINEKSNLLKDESGILVVPPIENPAFSHDLQIVEKENVEKPALIHAEKPASIVEEAIQAPKVIIDEMPSSQADTDFINKENEKSDDKKTKIDHSDLELEIKSVPEKSTEEQPIEQDFVLKNTKPYDPVLDLRDYKYPMLDLLENHGSEKIVQDSEELENNKNQIINTLKNYDIHIQKISATVGPTVTLYEIIPAAGVRISRIKNLEDDIALSLAALGIRIIAPIPGKGTIGIEVPNTRKTVVSMRTLLSSEKFQKNTFSLPIAIGKKIDNENFIVDLASMPHLLMAGATGQGKSVGLNAILVSLLYKKHPSQLKFVLVDPKKVELSIYKSIEKHFLAKLPGEEDAIITDTKKVVHTVNALCIEMDNRYDLLKEAGCRNIKEYNEKFIARKLNPEKGHQFLPFIVLVVDEFADLIMTAGKEVEMPIARLAQLARAVGIHLIIATQRPSVNIITGTIKANFPARIAFKVSSKIDSRTILDAGGAEQLIGKGDMLISYNGELVRLQCAFVDTPEVDKVVDFIGEQRGYPQAFLLPEYVDEKELEGKDFDLDDKDPLFEDAAKLIVSSQIGSTSLIQRRMKLGYNRAGRLMDQLEAAGVVGPSQGSKARDVLIKTEADLLQLFDTMA